MTIFKYRFLSIIRNKTLIFWNLIFPLVLVTFFGLTLPNAYATPEFDTIPVAVIKNDELQADTMFRSTLKAMEEMANPLLHVTYADVKEANDLLETGEVSGIIEKEDSFQLIVHGTGVNETILQSFLDEYMQKTSSITHLMERGAPMDQIAMELNESVSYTIDEENDHHDISSVFFFTIIAMCCLYTSFISLNCIHNVQANQSDLGARNSIAPLPKVKALTMDFVISYSIGFAILMIVMGYMIFGLGIDFGEHIGYILLGIAIGILAGNSIGVLLGVAIVKKKSFKIGILTAITLFLSMLSGMMFVQMKYFMDTYLPFISHLNPANMITDFLYALYYYGPAERYYTNIFGLLIVAALCYTASYFILRRKHYANI